MPHLCLEVVVLCFLFSFSLDLMVTPFPFKRVLPLFFVLYVHPHIKSEDTLNKLVLSFYLVGPGDGPWVTSFGNRCPYLPGYLTAQQPLPKEEAYLKMTVSTTSLLFILSRLAAQKTRAAAEMPTRRHLS